MGANANLPERQELEQRERLRVIAGGQRRRMRRYLLGAIILAALVILFLVLLLLRFAGRGPATGPPKGAHPRPTTWSVPLRLH